MKCLKWGKQRLLRTKETLRKNGLIEIVQRRDAEGKIIGWYIKVSYMVRERDISDCKVVIQRYQNPLVDESTCGEQNTNALKLNNKCLKTKKEMLAQYEEEFEWLWEMYPNKKGKKDAKKHFLKAREYSQERGTVLEALACCVLFLPGKNNKATLLYFLQTLSPYFCLALVPPQGR